MLEKISRIRVTPATDLRDQGWERAKQHTSRERGPTGFQEKTEDQERCHG